MRMAGEPAAPGIQQIGREAADFTLEDLAGGSRSLRGELAGRQAAVVVFSLLRAGWLFRSLRKERG